MRAANSSRKGSYHSSLFDVHFEQYAIRCHHMCSFPSLSVVMKGCDRDPARPVEEPSEVMWKGLSYWGDFTIGSWKSRTFNMMNASCFCGPHLSFSDTALRACL